MAISLQWPQKFVLTVAIVLRFNCRVFDDSSLMIYMQALIHQRVAEQALLTLQGFLDWVKFNILFLQECILLQILCLLLDEETLKIPACECLLIIVSRKVGRPLV